MGYDSITCDLGVVSANKAFYTCFSPGIAACNMDTPLFTQVGVLVVGAGPTGLGAATRLHQLGYDDFLLIDKVRTCVSQDAHPMCIASC